MAIQIFERTEVVTHRQIKNELNSLHRQQWTKKRFLKSIEKQAQDRLDRMARNGFKVPEKGGAFYVPSKAVDGLHRLFVRISRIHKDLNKRRARINKLEANLKVLPPRTQLYDKNGPVSDALDFSKRTMMDSNGEVLKIDWKKP